MGIVEVGLIRLELPPSFDGMLNVHTTQTRSFWYADVSLATKNPGTSEEATPSFLERLQNMEKPMGHGEIVVGLVNLGLQITDLIEGSSPGVVFAVGGFARDYVMLRTPVDLDLEVYGLKTDVLRELLESKFKVDETGKAFGVFKVQSRVPGGPVVDVSLPRRDSKVGPGHKGFLVEGDPYMSVMEAARRRDLTINSMVMSLKTGQVFDPFRGKEDIHFKLLKPTDPTKFMEDPLRVVRAAQFAARFEFEPTEELTRICSEMDLSELPKERIYEELRKLLLLGKKPSRGFYFLVQCGQLEKLFPEVAALQNVEQDAEYHPEGDVFVHTMMALDVAAKNLTGVDEEDFLVMLGILCHDLGKPMTTKFEDGRVRSRGHEEAGEMPTRLFLSRLTDDSRLADEVVRLVVDHLKPTLYMKAGVTSSAIRRLANRVNIDRLLRVARADHLGRTTGDALLGLFPAESWLKAQVSALNLEKTGPNAIKPLLLGRHLIECGMVPGPAFKPILDRAYEAQLDGTVTTLDEAIGFVGLLGARRTQGENVDE